MGLGISPDTVFIVLAIVILLISHDFCSRQKKTPTRILRQQVKIYVWNYNFFCTSPLLSFVIIIALFFITLQHANFAFKKRFKTNNLTLTTSTRMCLQLAPAESAVIQALSVCSAFLSRVYERVSCGR